MSDPIIETAVAFATSILESPVVGPIVVGAVRSITGWLQKKYIEKTGNPYDKMVLAGTMSKYLVAISALSVFVPPEYASALTLVVDIGWSAVKKLKNGKK